MAFGKVRDFHQILSKLKTFLDSRRCNDIYVRVVKLIWRQWCNTKLGNLLWIIWFCWPNVLKSFLHVYRFVCKNLQCGCHASYFQSQRISLNIHTHSVAEQADQLNGCQLIANVIFTDFHLLFACTVYRALNEHQPNILASTIRQAFTLTGNWFTC